MSGGAAAVLTFFALFIIVPLLGGLNRAFGMYACVNEGTRHVYVLFGNVVGILEEPGLHLLWFELGWRALLVNWLGQRHILDMRMDQE
mgnify:FL=1